MIGPLIFLCIIVPTLVAFIFVAREKKLKRQIDELEKKLHDRYEDLFSRAKFSELGLMSAGIAHEISSPLTVIQGRASYLLKHHKNPAKEQAMVDGLNQVISMSERIARTIQGMREYIYKDDKDIESAINLKELFDNILIFCGQRIKNHNIELRLIGLDHVYVRGNRVQLEQVFLNLINNAFDAVDNLNTKWIEISAVESSNKIEIIVKDSGDGIPEDVASHMMEPFFTTKKSRGAGLGLALIKGIVEQHSGKLSFHPEMEHTTFMVELPKADIGRVPRSQSERPVIQ